jgi:hypothetical protein
MSRVTPVKIGPQPAPKAFPTTPTTKTLPAPKIGGKK